MKILNILITLVVVSGTIGLFFLLGPVEKSSIFYTNLCLSIFIELLLFSAVIAVSGVKLFNIPNIAVAAQIGRYTFWLIFIMIGFNLLNYLLKENPLSERWYYGGLLVVTLIYTVIIGFSVQGAQQQLAQGEDVKIKSTQKTDLKYEAKELLNTLERIRSSNSFETSKMEECQKTILLLNDKVGSIPLAKFSTKADKIEIIRLNVVDLKSLTASLSRGSTDATTTINQIISESRQIIEKINLITNI